MGARGLGKRRGLRRAGALLCALATLLASVSALGVERTEAKPRFEVHERSLRLALRVEASNGYEGWVETEGHKRVTLTLYKGETTIEARTAGRVTRHGIDAGFGEMGRVAVRFRGRPANLGFRDRDEEPKCRGRRSTFERGHATGTIRFRGENGFTAVNARRAPAFLVRHYRRVCRHEPKDEAFGALFERAFNSLPLTTLRAGARVDGSNLVFEAAAIDLRPLFGAWIGVGYVFSAEITEHREGVRLTRSVGGEGDEGSFLFPRRKSKPRTATVAPPKPFRGTAKFLKRPGLPSNWTGPLAARLPGAGLVALTGPRFEAALCRITFGALLKGRCLPDTSRVRLQLLSSLGPEPGQGSGSHSQPLADVRLSWSR